MRTVGWTINQSASLVGQWPRPPFGVSQLVTRPTADIDEEGVANDRGLENFRAKKRGMHGNSAFEGNAMHVTSFFR